MTVLSLLVPELSSKAGGLGGAGVAGEGCASDEIQLRLRVVSGLLV